MHLLALLACGAPITNAPFLEEAEFVGLMPTSDRFGAPVEVLAAPSGDAVLLEAKIAAEGYRDLVDVPTLLGDHLQALGPSIREENLRVWEPSKVTTDDVELFVQAEVERPVRAGGDLLLAIEIGPTRGGPWTPVAEGAWDGDSRGELVWDLDATASALEVVVTEPLGTISASFDDRGFLESERVVELDYTLQTGEAASFVAAGDVLLSFGAVLQVTDDGASWPGYATVVHHADAGGYASGGVFVGEDEIGFVRCWNAAGATVHVRGDAGIATVGEESACIEGSP